MNYFKIKSYFQFTKEQRIAVFILLLIIVLLQVGWFIYGINQSSIAAEPSQEEKQWLALQIVEDSLKSLAVERKFEISPFNPNFISDYKGYKLGMSVHEIDRLFAYRKQDKYVNSAEEFQKVTKISDSLLKSISPYFKFPDWVKNKKEHKEYVNYDAHFRKDNEKIKPIDINDATQEDLMKVYGVGAAISERILKFKESVGCFVSMEQMDDIWGLNPEVITKLKARFKIITVPKIKKLDINNASLKEISQFPYFRYALAKEIITYRTMNGDFKNPTDLTKIKGLSIEKANIIALYLDF